jgi:AAA+ superfamily predicted ATPase
MAEMDFVNELRRAMGATRGIVAVDAGPEPDEGRIRQLSVDCVAKTTTKDGKKFNVVEFRAAGPNKGLVTIYSPEGRRAPRRNPDADMPSTLFDILEGWVDGPTELLAYDLNSLMDLLSARQAKDFAEKMKSCAAEQFVQIIIIDPNDAKVPFGVTRIKCDTPDAKVMKALMDNAAKMNDCAMPAENGDLSKCLRSLAGLSYFQAENAIAESIAATGGISPSFLLRVKERQAKKASMEIVQPAGGLEMVGGLEALKAYVLEMQLGFDPIAAAEYDLPSPSGILLTGVPGVGKSLIAKAIAGHLGFPLLRYNGSNNNKYQGETERLFREMLAAADAMQPCVLYIDEAEKVFATGDATTDGGTSERVMGEFLNWMQEHTTQVFVIMTANDPRKLRAEFLRAGRIDDKFWLDVPNYAERLSIMDVFGRKFRKLGNIDKERVAQVSRDATGAEIEAACKKCLRAALARKAEVTTEDLIAAIQTTPKVVTAWKDKLQELRDWGRDACIPASLPDDSGPSLPLTRGRKVDVM